MISLFNLILSIKQNVTTRDDHRLISEQEFCKNSRLVGTIPTAVPASLRTSRRWKDKISPETCGSILQHRMRPWWSSPFIYQKKVKHDKKNVWNGWNLINSQSDGKKKRVWDVGDCWCWWRKEQWRGKKLLPFLAREREREMMSEENGMCVWVLWRIYTLVDSLLSKSANLLISHRESLFYCFLQFYPYIFKQL